MASGGLVLFLTAAILLYPTLCLADGELDPEFGAGGRALTAPLGAPIGGNDGAYAVIRQADGKIVAAGEANGPAWDDFALVRLNEDGSADTTFGANGRVTTAIGIRNDVCTALIEQPDGKLVAAGYSDAGIGTDFALVRYNQDGSLDLNFGLGGTVRTDLSIVEDKALALVRQTDGKLVAAGFTESGSDQDIALVRYEADGILDPTFGTGGVVITPMVGLDGMANAVVQQQDGKLVVAGAVGYTGFVGSVVIRYLENGDLDASFGDGGIAVISVSGGEDRARALVVQWDGKLIIAGQAKSTFPSFSLARLNSDGTLDVDFGTGGVVVTSTADWSGAYALHQQADGRLVATGFSGLVSPTFALVRYEPNGSLDSNFGVNGMVLTELDQSDEARALVPLPDGRFVVAGFSRRLNSTLDMALVRYHPDGEIDESFGELGVVFADVGQSRDYLATMVRQADGNLLAVGTTSNGDDRDFLIVRYDPNGALDQSFGSGGWVISGIGPFDDVAHGVVQQFDGRIVVVGTTFRLGATAQTWDFALTRYNPDGSLDDTFGGDGKVITEVGSGDDTAYAVAQQADGKLIVAGYGGQLVLARYNADGSLDPTFDGDGIAKAGSGAPYAVLQQADGKVVAAGYRGSTFLIVRRNEDGSADGTFHGNGWVTTDVGGGRAYALIQQADGKLVAAGYGGVGGVDFTLVRYNGDGSLDGNFGVGGKVFTAIGPSSDRAYALLEQADGRLVAAGMSHSAEIFGFDAFALVRYEADGNVDPTFGTNGKVTVIMGSGDGEAYAVVVQPDADLVAAGSAYDQSGNSVFALARLQVAVCGNGFTEDGEQCDDGVSNGTGGSCCTASCALKPDGPASCDGNICTQPDTCTAGVCVPGGCATGQSCSFCGGTCADDGGACGCLF